MRRVSFIVMFMGLLGFFAVQAPSVSALSNVGPDPADYGGVAGDTFSYNLINSDSAQILSIEIPLYFKTSGTKVVTLRGADLCTPADRDFNNSSQNPLAGTTNTVGPPTYAYKAGVVISSFSYVGQTTTPTYGVVSTSSTCYTNTKTVTIPASSLVYDGTIGYYRATLKGSIYAGRYVQNRFRIQIESTGIVGYTAAGAANSFGVARDHAQSGYRKYAIPFAPACGYSGGTARVSIYDDDNFDTAIQGTNPFEIRIWFQRPDGTTGYVPFSNYSTPGMDYVSSTTLRPHAGNDRTVFAEFTVRPDYKYKLEVSSVYWVNILQFKLPFDSIYYLADCIEPPTCTATMTPGVLPPGVTTAIRSTVRTSYALIDPRPRLDMLVTGPGSQTFGGVGYSQSGRTLTISPINYSPPAPGRYTMQWRLSGGSLPSAVTCSQTFSVGYQPYFRVSGGDLWSGGLATASGVQSWNIDRPADYYGGGTDLATLASGDIANFATGRGLSGGASVPYGLSFANESSAVNLTAARYGGGLTAVPPTTDYYNLVYSQAKPMTGNIVNVGLLASGVYRYSGDIAVFGTVPAGRSVTLITNGNVFVSGGGVSYAAYNLTTIPRLNVFTRSGDIRVASTVSELHGFYATGGSGKFYSCALPTGVPQTSTPVTYADTGSRFNDCNRRLKIYGAALASELVLTRTFGSINTANRVPAEEFVYSPEAWVANTGYSSGAPQFQVQSYLQLPPIL